MDILHDMMRKNNVNRSYDITDELTGSPGSYDYLKEHFIFRPRQIETVTKEFNRKYNCSLSVYQVAQIVAAHEIGHACDPFLSIRMNASFKHHFYAKSNFFHEDKRSRYEYKKYAKLKLICERSAWVKAPLFLLSPISKHEFSTFQRYCLDSYHNSFLHEYKSLLLVSHIMQSFSDWSSFFPLNTALKYQYDSATDSYYDKAKGTYIISFNHLLSKKTSLFKSLSTYSFALYQFVYDYLASLSNVSQQQDKSKIISMFQGSDISTSLRTFAAYEKESLQMETQILNEMALQFSSPSFETFYSASLARKASELTIFEESLLPAALSLSL